MMKIGVLISGGGTNLQSIIDTVHGKSGEIAVVISNKADAYGLTRAKNADIPAEVIVENDCADVDDFNAKMIDVLKDYESASEAHVFIYYPEEDPAAIVSVDDERGMMAATWYTLDGRKLSVKPTTKGLYIFNGKKIAIK